MSIKYKGGTRNAGGRKERRDQSEKLTLTPRRKVAARRQGAAEGKHREEM